MTVVYTVVPHQRPQTTMVDVARAWAPSTFRAIGPGQQLQGMPDGLAALHNGANTEVTRGGGKSGGLIVQIGGVAVQLQMLAGQAALGATVKTAVAGAATASTGSMTSTAGSGGNGSSSYVYQLVDDAGEAVYYGVSNNPVVRLGRHALQPPGPFRGMQVISEAVARPQALALETSLIQQARAEGRLIYNIAQTSISATAPIAVPSMLMPLSTLWNPALYLR